MKNEISLSLKYIEKHNLFASRNIDNKVYEYLESILGDLYIDIANLNDGNILELMSQDKLQGWCFQTTESAILFFKDYDYIERGDLYLDDLNYKYYHAWITFKFEDQEYVFDPALNIISTKKDYVHLFCPEVKGYVSAKIVRQEFLKQVNEYKNKHSYEEDKIVKELQDYYKVDLSGDYLDYIERKKKLIKFHAAENPYEPFYHNSARYDCDIEDDKLKKVMVKYYKRFD